MMMETFCSLLSPEEMLIPLYPRVWMDMEVFVLGLMDS